MTAYRTGEAAAAAGASHRTSNGRVTTDRSCGWEMRKAASWRNESPVARHPVRRTRQTAPHAVHRFDRCLRSYLGIGRQIERASPRTYWKQPSFLVRHAFEPLTKRISA